MTFLELAILQEHFDEMCDNIGIVWTDEDVKSEALNQFIVDYEEGIENPEVRLCGYGYVTVKP